MRKRTNILLLLVISISACAASLPQDRRDYVLAHPHGWIEVTLADHDIPYLPPTKEKPDEPVFPHSCYVKVEINNETFLSSYAYPYGEEPPFSVDTGFRFPAPAGVLDLEFTYSGCDVEEGEEITTIMDTVLDVTANHVTEIQFDGDNLIVLPEKKNKVVTLEDIYEALTGSREAQE